MRNEASKLKSVSEIRILKKKKNLKLRTSQPVRTFHYRRGRKSQALELRSLFLVFGSAIQDLMILVSLTHAHPCGINLVEGSHADR